MNLFKLRFGSSFRTRSAERDFETDKKRIKSIASVLDPVLRQAQDERAGLKRRIEGVITRAAIVGGNDQEDYLTRTEEVSKMLSTSDSNIRLGEKRLAVLDQNIGYFNFLSSEFKRRFSGAQI